MLICNKENYISRNILRKRSVSIYKEHILEVLSWKHFLYCKVNSSRKIRVANITFTKSRFVGSPIAFTGDIKS